MYLSHSVDIDQFQRETVGLRCLRLPPLSLVSWGSPQVLQKSLRVDSDHLRRLHPLQGSPTAPVWEYSLPHVRDTITVRNIGGLLSRITALEALFSKRPGNIEEQRRQNDLIRYAVSTPSGPGVDHSPAGLEAPKGSCSPSLSMGFQRLPCVSKHFYAHGSASKCWEALEARQSWFSSPSESINASPP